MNKGCGLKRWGGPFGGKEESGHVLGIIVYEVCCNMDSFRNLLIEFF